MADLQEEKQTETSPESEKKTPDWYTGQTDRSSGEYRHRNGYTETIYSDAGYVHQDEETAPPRYYAPPKQQPRTPRKVRFKQVQEAEAKRKDRKKISIAAAFCLCVVCAILGGAAGAVLMSESFSPRLEAIEAHMGEADAERQALAEQSQVLTQQREAAAISQQSAERSGPALSQIYDMACQQVVAITTEITYTNFFGFSSSSPVSGSGFVISGDGYILTNYHVIEEAYKRGCEITVMQYDGSSYRAQIVGVEAENDVAVLKIDATGLLPATFGSSNGIAVGDQVFAVGNPLGELEFTMTFGHVSALNRSIITDDKSEPITMFQFDAAVNSGNSGGPLYDEQGNVIGIVTAKFKSNGVEGLGFAIPISDAAAIAEDLILHGYVTGKASLGLLIDERYNSLYGRYYNMPEGAYVYSVEKGGCADRAGLRAGDVITAIGEFVIDDNHTISHALRQFSAGDMAELSYYRDGEISRVMITFDEAGASSAKTASRTALY
ncbi:MAG: S1C family serine protease [Oscillospiraceae bacterium]|nr:S1C family serine protease [Oscillospiraceae bacterium]